MPKPTNEWARFSKATPEVKQRIIAASYGEPGVGKSTFWLTAPGPIVIQSLDMGLEGVVEPFTKTKDIYVAEYDWHPTDDMDQAEAIELRDKFIEDFEHAIQHARTIVWDRETDVWELFRYAEFGAPNDNPKDYAKLYQRYRRYVNMPKATDINFGLVQGMKTPWGMKTSGGGAQKLTKSVERVRKGMDEIESLVHVNIEHMRVAGKLSIRVGKSRGPGGRDIQDQDFPAMSFPEFATLVFPESELEYWQ